jgi:hypothetical protein
MEMYEGEVELERDQESAIRRRKKNNEKRRSGMVLFNPAKKRRDGEKGG